MKKSVMLGIIGIVLLANFVNLIDFSKTNLPGFVWEGNTASAPARPMNVSLSLNDLNARTNPPRVPIYFVEGAKAPYMRTAVYNVYREGRWYEDLSYKDSKSLIFNTVYRVTPLIVFKEHIPVFKGTVFVSVEGEYNRSAGVFHIESCNTSYVGFAYVKDVKPSEFAKDGFSKIEMDEKKFERIRELTLRVTKNASSDYEKVLAIERFLKNNYRYDFRYESRGDPVYWFLFVGKRGICKHFASAFVVMCNSIGIPARLVVGYKVKPVPWNQTVFADQAHAWAEVKFKEGWMEFDPTPSNLRKKIPTETRITYVDERVIAGKNFTVEGVVESSYGKVDGFVEIYLKRDKGERGILLGLYPVKDGKFKAVVRTNITGRYHVVAHYVGSFMYSESWSDPVVEIYEKPSLIVDLPERIPKDFLLEGRLISKSLPAELDISVDGRTYRVWTDDEGRFKLRLNLERGYHRISVDYRGGKYVLPVHFEKEVEVGDLDVVLSKDVLVAGEKNEVAVKVFFNGKPVERFFVNGKLVRGNVTLIPEDVGTYVLNVSAYGFSKRLYLKVVSDVEIDYGYDDGLKVFVKDFKGRGINGTVYVNGKAYRLVNGFAEVPLKGEAEIYYPGDDYHLPKRLKAVPKPPLIYYLVPLLAVLSIPFSLKAYNLYKYGITLELVKEHPELPNIWKVNERIEFRVKCRSNYEVLTDGILEGNSMTFKDVGGHRIEVRVYDGKGNIRNSKVVEVDVVKDYGDGICRVFKMIEVDRSLTPRETLKVRGCELETLRWVEEYVYGGRRGFGRDKFVKAFEEVKSCLGG